MDVEDLKRKLEEANTRIRQLIIDRDGWQFRAEEKYRLRKELEDALGISQDMSHDNIARIVDEALAGKEGEVG